MIWQPQKSIKSKHSAASFTAVFIALAVMVAIATSYYVYIAIDTYPIMRQLAEIAEEPPNSRELFKDDFWILNSEADDNGNITRRVTKITRDYLWVWGNEGTMQVHIYLDEKNSNGESYSGKADWLVRIVKQDGDWMIARYNVIL